MSAGGSGRRAAWARLRGYVARNRGLYAVWLASTLAYTAGFVAVPRLVGFAGEAHDQGQGAREIAWRSGLIAVPAWSRDAAPYVSGEYEPSGLVPHDDDSLFDDDTPYELLRQEIARLEPQKVYLPLGVGGHVDHQLCREVGIRLLQEGRRWVMPGPDYAGIVAFYEDFPYAWWNDFKQPEDLGGANPVAALPPEVSMAPEYADITDQIERKIMGISLYESQLERLFDGDLQMADAVRQYGRALAEVGGVDGSAERYWVSGRV